MRARRWQATALALLMAGALTAGCGQKPGVNQLVAGPGGQPVMGAGGVAAPGGDLGLGAPPAAGDPAAGGLTGTGGVAGAAGSSEVVGGSAAGGSSVSGGGSTAGGSPSGTGGSGGAGTPGAAPVVPAGGPGDTTGVTDKTIKIGVHAPVTGAAAFPQASFERGVGVYADYINRKGGVNGRKLEIEFRDDGFDPNKARNACKELAEQEKVFLLIGAAGADQIDACARYASAAGVPYLSSGVHESRPGLGSLGLQRTYFATSLTYEQQVGLLTNLVRREFNGQKVALIVADNDSLNDYYAKQNASLSSAVGKNLVLSRRIPKRTDVDAPTIATAICNSLAKVVVWNASPSGLINVSKSMPCRVTFVGPGNTNALNIVAGAGCPNIDGAQFYSSYPGLDKIDQMDPTFRPAYRQKTGAEPDDIGIGLWGVEKLVAQMLSASGKSVTRQSFMATIASGRSFNAGVLPTSRFGNTRFGGTAMHLMQADCSARQFRTKRLNEAP